MRTATCASTARACGSSSSTPGAGARPTSTTTRYTGTRPTSTGAASRADPVQATVERRGRRRPATRVAARAAAVLLCMVTVSAALVLTPATASAHPLSTTAILLDVGSHQVTGQVQLPIDRLSISLNRPLSATVVVQPVELEELRQYVAGHVSATDPADGAAWAVSVTGGRVQSIDNVDHLVFDLALLPPGGTARDFQLHYDAI